MSDFDTLWRWINNRGSVITVQEYNELKHVYDLMKACSCESYLEVGSAEGNSLYVLGHAVTREIDYIDLGEKHTEAARHEVIRQLNVKINGYLGDSRNPQTLPKRKYDCVLIDGGHDFDTVLSDAEMYAPLATKYVFFHDIQLEPVKRAVEQYVKEHNLTYRTFINSDTFGYGIIEK